MLEVPCHRCGKCVQRKASRVRWNASVGRKNFCSQYCTRSYAGNLGCRGVVKGHAQRTELTPFNWFARVIRQRAASKLIVCSVGARDLYLLWNQQDGKCALTNWPMLLPHNSAEWQRSNSPDRASIDRIDPLRGYEPDNIRFVCIMANYAKNAYTDDDLLRFCRAVLDNTPSR